ncbi:uncharacterized protein LOC114326596 [Diabrotica virgifera virgifera]|uniref:Uncharacterized protein n=1 Tax=Diabrotica virgifera virgifera TaxID=50390 RepID=A0ABM5IE43_DIAVI|nr:uncharacterized protein LOC114326596 [Diabrotica virgifera virgifera]
MWVRCFVSVLFLINVFHSGTSIPNPSLYNLPRAIFSLAGSASASSSSVDTSESAKFTNIVDYHKKEEKRQQLQTEKRIGEDDDISDDPAEKEENEASPSFLQKKVNKILAKIQLFSTFSDSSATQDLEVEEETKSNSTEETPKSDVIIDFGDFPSPTPKVAGSQKVVVPAEYGAPLRLTWDNNDAENITDIEHIINPNCTHIESTNKLGQIGVYFAELFGSIVGLAYGAMAHINNALTGQNKPETTI